VDKARVAKRQGEKHDFRGDIQGLRGIAVLLVLLFHAQIPGIRGGFVGVDVFFVISGYLITGNLLRELQKTGSINFREFYARRIRRLLPASLFVLLVTLITAIFLFPPILLPGLALDVTSAGFYIPNIDFAIRATDYFSNSLIPSPVLHYWSLGVEEQYYLCWPLLLLLVARGKRRRNTHILLLFGALFIGSIELASWWLPHNQPWAFYALPTRAWELILGAFIAAYSKYLSRLPRNFLSFIGVVGFVLVIGSGIFQNDPLHFPGKSALIPTTGAFLLILGGLSRAPGIATRILKVSPLQQLGKISYSLYLWHWPILVIPQVAIGNHIHLIYRSLLALLSIAIAIVSERYIERPFRSGKLALKNPTRTIAVALAVTCVVSATAFSADYGMTGALRNRHGAESAQEQREFIDAMVIPTAKKANVAPLRAATKDFPVPLALEPSLLDAKKDRPISYADGCHNQMNVKPVMHPCIYGVPTSKTTVVLFGDSHALAWFPALNEVAKENDWRLLSLTMSACSPADIPAYNPQTASVMTNCPIWRKEAIARIVAEHPYLVLVAGTSGFESYSHGVVISGEARIPFYKSGMNRTIRELQQTSSHVILMSDTPAQSQDPTVCLSQHPKSTLACATPASQAISSEWMAVEGEVASHNSIPIIRPQYWVCPTDPCPVVIGKILTYLDTGHMTATFSQALAGKLKTALANALGMVQ